MGSAWWLWDGLVGRPNHCIRITGAVRACYAHAKRGSNGKETALERQKGLQGVYASWDIVTKMCARASPRGGATQCMRIPSGRVRQCPLEMPRSAVHLNALAPEALSSWCLRTTLYAVPAILSSCQETRQLPLAAHTRGYDATHSSSTTFGAALSSTAHSPSAALQLLLPRSLSAWQVLYRSGTFPPMASYPR